MYYCPLHTRVRGSARGDRGGPLYAVGRRDRNTMKRNRTERGTFAPNSGLKGETISIRLPVAIDGPLRQVTGWDSSTPEDRKASNRRLKAFIEQAIAEKLEREQPT